MGTAISTLENQDALQAASYSLTFASLFLSRNDMNSTYGKSFYNDIGLRFAQKVFGLKYLHYGYFENVPTTLDQLPAAQEVYVQQVLSHIPADVKKILDVGCGAGGVALNLVNRGMDVTCVDPDPFMLEKTSELTNHRIQKKNDFYEKADGLPENHFDMVLMSESCQYVPFGEGFRQHRRFLRPGGYVLISDFFKIRDLDLPYLSKSGHRFEEFVKEAAAQGFELVTDRDITRQTAPTHEIYQKILLEKAFPVAEALFEYVERRYPKFYKMMVYFVGKKVLFLKQKYSSQGADIFIKYKSYRILLFKKK